MRTIPFFVFLVSLGAIFYITGNKVNQYGASDPLLTLPTSQALVETLTPHLTHLENEIITPDGRPLRSVIDNYQAAEINGEIVDVYSPGPAFLALPVTIILRLTGSDLNNPATNMAVQNRLAFLTSSIALILLYFLCRVWLEVTPSLVISHVTFFGSSAFANMGLAYFNLNIAVVFSCMVLFLLAILERKENYEEHHASILHRYFISASPAFIGTCIGLCLFLAFAGRPSAAILIVITFGYLLLNHHRKVAIYSMSSALICLVLFSLWSQAEYDLILPNYYNLAKSNDAPLPIWVGILGNLISPSRGMIIFMPWLLLIPIMMIIQRRIITSKLSIWIGIWFVLLLVTVSRSVIWWGGSSFGPRLMAETLPGLILLGVSGWHMLEKESHLVRGFQRPLLIGFFLVSGAGSIWINSYQPFFNIFTGGAWQENITGFPLEIEDSLGPFFKWEYSQWRANADQICQQNADMMQNVFLPDERLFQKLDSGDIVTHLTDNQLNVESIAKAHSSRFNGQLPTSNVVFQGFLLPQGDAIWSMCESAAVYFIPDDTLIKKQTIELTLSGRSVKNQPIDLFINGNLASQISTSTQINSFPENKTVQFDSSLLKSNKINSIELRFPNIKTIQLPDSALNAKGKFGYQLTSLSLNVID